MAAPPGIFPLPRKLKTSAWPAAAELRRSIALWRVHEDCKQLWQINKRQNRRDTFVGLVDTDTWVIYLAPTFGVPLFDSKNFLGVSTSYTDPIKGPMRDEIPGRELSILRRRLANFEALPDHLTVLKASTSKEADNATEVPLKEVTAAYDKGACLVAFRDKNGFDGNSHPSLIQWVAAQIRPRPAESWDQRALGFAIQRDNAGYFVRFASGYNQGAGSLVTKEWSTVFHARAHQHLDKEHEPRDLPKEWSEVLTEVLARELEMGRFPLEEGARGRLISRGESITSKYTRLT
jgi:hypothetical protein